MQRLTQFTLTLALCLCGEPLSAEPVAGSFTDCDGCPDMVTAPAGSFTMGSPENEKGRNSWEGPQRTVTFARPFAVGKFEVTRGQFAAFVQASRYTVSQGCWTTEDGKTDYRRDRSWRNPGFAQDDLHPAACLNGRDIKAYVDWLAKKTGKGYRLITEAEWEYAARARTTPGPAPRFGFGDDEDALCAHANGLDQSAKSVLRKFETDQLLDCSDGYVHTAPVGKFAANKFGLHDMIGNVKEWTADCFQGDQGYRGAPADGTAWTTGSCQLRILRGGSWLSFARLLRVATRYRQALDDRSSEVGLRVARTLP